MPKMLPGITCVVETGSANGDASITRAAAQNPSIRANRVLHACWHSSSRFQFAQFTAARFVTKYYTEQQ